MAKVLEKIAELCADRRPTSRWNTSYLLSASPSEVVLGMHWTEDGIGGGTGERVIIYTSPEEGVVRVAEASDDQGATRAAMLNAALAKARKLAAVGPPEFGVMDLRRDSRPCYFEGAGRIVAQAFAAAA